MSRAPIWGTWPLSHQRRQRRKRTLNDIAGRPIRGWDARGQAFWFVYDAARRATRRYVSVASAPKVLLDLTIYGEGRPDANLCGRVFRRYDGAGYVENRRHDFKGNLVASARQLAAVYKQVPTGRLWRR